MSAKTSPNSFFKRNSLAWTLIAVVGFMSLLLSLSYNFITSDSPDIAKAATEPACQTVTNSPTWNPYPINTIFPNPIVTSGACQDMPLLSFFPVDTRSGNPRERNILRSQNFSIQLYYNNGAVPGSNAITNPTVRTQLTRVSDTRYRVSAELSGGNTGTVTSAQKGGDLFINVPAGARFDIVANSTDHFPDAIERREETDATGRRPNDSIADNTTGTNVSNPIYSAFEGKTLPSTNGFVLKSGGLEAGFLGYGYILTQIGVTIGVQPIANNPPIIPGEEITIIRGESGAFRPLAPTDPDNDYPVTLDLNQIPAGCTLSGTANSQGGGQIITCQTTQSTPSRFSFVLTPTDSRNLVGTPGTFIVNVIDPRLELTKRCFVRNTDRECRNSPLQAGDEITYRINVRNSSTVRANNLRIVDVYDGQRLTNIREISDSGVLTTNNSTITWANLGTLNAGQNREVTFDATVAQGVQLGDIVINTARASADGVPEVEARADFTIGGSLDLVKRCFVRNTTTPCNQGNLVSGGLITYEIDVTNSTRSAVNNVVLRDTYDSTKLTDIGNFQPAADFNPSQSQITWQIGTLATGATRTVRFDARLANGIAPGTNITNVVVVTADGVPERRAENVFPIAGPSLIAEKLCFRRGTSTPCSSAGLNPGDNISYVIRTTNNGTVAAQNVTITDTYDTTKLTAITNIEPQGTLNATAGTILWTVGTMDPGRTVETRFDATIRTDIPAGSVVVNTAVIRATDIPDIVVRATFTLVFIAPTVTPRTGGEIGLIFIALAIGLGAAAYYYYKKNGKFTGAFVPARNSENGKTEGLNKTQFDAPISAKSTDTNSHRRVAPKKKS